MQPAPFALCPAIHPHDAARGDNPNIKTGALVMSFLTTADIRFVASVLIGGRTLLAVPDAESVIHIVELIGGQLQVPQDFPNNRMPGEKHSCARFGWIPAAGGREQLRLYYGSRPEGAMTGPFFLTYQDLPWTQPSLASINQETTRMRSLLEQAGNVLGQAQ
jgi:hypothetical protein